MENMINNYLPGLLLAFITSYFTVKLTMRMNKTEKWWEKRAEVYSSLIAALHNTKFFLEENIEADHCEKDLEKEYSKSLDKLCDESQKNISMIIDSGAFYISSTAIDRLIAYKKDFIKAKNETCGLTFLCDSLKATDSCLKDIIEIGKKELKVK